MQNFKLNETEILSNQDWTFPTNVAYGPGRLKEIGKICMQIGSDVILGINPSDTVLTSKNIIKKFSKTPKFYTLLVRPNFGCSTKKIYSGVKKYTAPIFNVPKRNMFSLGFLLKQDNALEKIAFSKHPKLKIIKSCLENLNKPLFVRMTGSGSVLVAYYQKKQDVLLNLKWIVMMIY